MLRTGIGFGKTLPCGFTDDVSGAGGRGCKVNRATTFIDFPQKHEYNDYFKRTPTLEGRPPPGIARFKSRCSKPRPACPLQSNATVGPAAYF